MWARLLYPIAETVPILLLITIAIIDPAPHVQRIYVHALKGYATPDH